jgi:hypothetical protein
MAAPFLALIAGILILIVPRILNYVIVTDLVLIGLIGNFWLMNSAAFPFAPRGYSELV